MGPLVRLFVTQFLFVALPFGWGQEPPQKKLAPAQPLMIRLALESRDFPAGKPISVSVEVSNCSDSPLLIGSFVLLGSGGTPVSGIEFELKDAQGHVVPSSYEMISDSFSAETQTNVATAFLRSYLLLYPRYSLSTKFRISPRQYRKLEKPGTYSISATYSSNGLSYTPAYRQAGLSDEDVKSVPFKSWSGKSSTNEVRFRVRPAGPVTKKEDSPSSPSKKSGQS